jgi:hypothetical protein
MSKKFIDLSVNSRFTFVEPIRSIPPNTVFVKASRLIFYPESEPSAIYYCSTLYGLVDEILGQEGRWNNPKEKGLL